MRNWSGMASRMPAPSPVLASQPQAPRWVLCRDRFWRRGGEGDVKKAIRQRHGGGEEGQKYHAEISSCQPGEWRVAKM